MIDWWESKLDLFCQIGIKKDDFTHLALESQIILRNGISELLATQARLKMPFYVVSGGITEIIESVFTCTLANNEIIDEHHVHAIDCWENTKIFSNKFVYEEEKH